jgi:hypothetical protein
MELSIANIGACSFITKHRVVLPGVVLEVKIRSEMTAATSCSHLKQAIDQFYALR